MLLLPSDQLSMLMFYKAFWAHSSTSFVQMPMRHQRPWEPSVFKESATICCMKLSFINIQKLPCLWPENLKVMRTTIETYQCRSRSVRAAVGVISSGAMDPTPAWGSSSVLVTKLVSLVTVQMTGALVKDISPPVESQVSSQIGC